MYGICNLAIIPLRIEPNDRSEQVSQVLFGEHFEILEQLKQWFKIRLQYDNYEGWIDSKQCQIITENDFTEISNSAQILNQDLVEYVTTGDNLLIPIPIGASLSFLNYDSINKNSIEFEGLKVTGIKPKKRIN